MASRHALMPTAPKANTPNDPSRGMEYSKGLFSSGEFLSEEDLELGIHQKLNIVSKVVRKVGQIPPFVTSLFVDLNKDRWIL